VIIQLLVRGDTGHAVPYYGVGVFLPITAMGLAMRKHILLNVSGRKRTWGLVGVNFSIALSTFVFVGQIAGKWFEGGWLVLIALIVVILMAHAILISPIGYRDPDQIYRIVRVKSRVEGPMGAIVEWQALKVQEYRYKLLIAIAKFWENFGVRRPVRFEPPVIAGEFEEAVEAGHARHSYLEAYLSPNNQVTKQSSQAKEEPSPEQSP